jgi:PAS domain S-box-containing protein
MLPGKDTELNRSSLELMYHVSRELATALDMRTVLQRILFLSMKTVGAGSGSILVIDDNGKPVESVIIRGSAVHNHTTQRLGVMLDGGLAGWVVRHRTPVLVRDTRRDERWLLQDYEKEALTSARSAVSAPLLVRERLTGVMTLVHPQAGFFTPDHLELVQAISDQASIAVLNARLVAESQRQAQVMTALADSAAAITSSLNLEDVLAHIMDQTTQALRVQAVTLALIDPQTNELVVQAATGSVRHLLQNTRFQMGKGIAGWVAQEGVGVVVDDARRDPRFDSETDQRTGYSTQAVACAPLRYCGEVIGILEALNPEGNLFDPDALLVLTGIGSLAGTAVRNAQLFEHLQAAHQSYLELFEDSIDPILITNWQGLIVEANRQAAAAAEYPQAELLQSFISQLLTPDLELLGAQFENIQGGKTISYESELRTHRGHKMPIQVYVRQVSVKGISHIQWILRDLSERKNLDTLREDLISMIYHDLRSPLANVVSSLDVLNTTQPVANDPTARSLVGIAMRSTERIQRLTSSLLDINRLEAGQPLGVRQPMDVLELIREAHDLLMPIAVNKHQTLILDLPHSLPTVLGDADMIRRVITNLLENAIKFSSSGSLTSIGASQQDGWVQVWIQDQGPGIPEVEHGHIFDKFFRLKNRESSKGMGLGLAYCKLAVQVHGGQIWVESGFDSGSRFIFKLPVADTQPAG